MSHAADPESVGMSRSRLERIGPAMQAYVDSGVYAGVSTLVARRGVVVHEAQFGARDKEAGKPMTADTIFRLYSMEALAKRLRASGCMYLIIQSFSVPGVLPVSSAIVWADFSAGAACSGALGTWLTDLPEFREAAVRVAREVDRYAIRRRIWVTAMTTTPNMR